MMLPTTGSLLVADRRRMASRLIERAEAFRRAAGAPLTQNAGWRARWAEAAPALGCRVGRRSFPAEAHTPPKGSRRFRVAILQAANRHHEPCYQSTILLRLR